LAIYFKENKYIVNLKKIVITIRVMIILNGQKKFVNFLNKKINYGKPRAYFGIFYHD